jgi:hypothetical protein
LAVRRRQAPVTAPDELVVFDPVEWLSAEAMTWAKAFRRWQLARHAWVKEHPDGDLGDLLDCLREEVRMKRDYWDSLSAPA